MSKRLVPPVAVILLAGFLFLFRLSTPPSLAFDEVYYARDARSHRVGAERLTAKEYGTVAACDRNQNPDHICSWVHAPLGNYLIAIGELLGPETCPSPTDQHGNAQTKGKSHCNPFDWRLSSAIAGILTVALAIGLGFLLFDSWIWASLSGALMTLDGLFLTSSRIAMLDIFLTLFLMAAFLFLALDLKRARNPWCPYRFAAGIFFGLAMSVKWSAVLGIATASVLVIGLSLTRPIIRQIIGNSGWQSLRWWAKPVFAEKTSPVLNDLQTAIPPAIEHGENEKSKSIHQREPSLWWLWSILAWIIALCAIPVLIYGAAWIPWLARHGWSWHEFVALHERMYNYHETLRAAHNYASSTLSWLVLNRPVAYYFSSNGNLRSHVLDLGNPIFWWVALGALGALAIYWIRKISRLALVITGTYILSLALCIILDLPSWATISLTIVFALGITITWIPRLELTPAFILVAYLAMYVPWLFQARTKFFYYMLPNVAIMAFAVVWVTRWVWDKTTNWSSSPVSAIARMIVLLTYASVLIAFILFYPVWTALPISADWWRNLMWLRSWI